MKGGHDASLQVYIPWNFRRVYRGMREIRMNHVWCAGLLLFSDPGKVLKAQPP